MPEPKKLEDEIVGSYLPNYWWSIEWRDLDEEPLEPSQDQEQFANQLAAHLILVHDIVAWENVPTELIHESLHAQRGRNHDISDLRSNIGPC